jgi:hypothetical protein
MKVKIESLLCNKPKWVSNYLDVNSIGDLDKVIRMVVTDRSAILTREDGKSTEIVNTGCVRTEIWNQKQLLVDWLNLRVDDFPEAGKYIKSSI